MLKSLILALGLCGAVALTAIAADDNKPPAKKRQLTEEQKTIMKEIKEKYDKDKDGKLSAEERKAMSAEDKERLAKAGLGPRKKKDDAK
jgi:ABC-type transporter MlaC component